MSATNPKGRLVAAGAALGTLTLVAGLAVSAPASAAPNHVVISEAYGGGGNSGATLKNDFVELYNPTGSAISLAGWKVSYYSATGNLGNACTLPETASIAAGAHFLIQQAAGTGGTADLPTPDATCTAAMSGSAGSIEVTDASTAVVDLVGYGATATRREGTPAPGTTNTTSAQRKADSPSGYVDTDDNGADFITGTPTPQNGGAGTPGGGGGTPAPEKTIAEIQGTGLVSPLSGQVVATSGVVTAVYPTGGFNGFYLQTAGSGGATDATPGASDGIFVYGTTKDGANADITVGSCYDVTGTVTEYGGSTEAQKLTELTSPTVTPKAGACTPAAPVELEATPTDAEKESLEGMLVLPKGEHTITNNYQLNQYGQLGLVKGDTPLFQATEVVAPGPDAVAYERANQARLITLDDGSSWNYMSNATAKNSALPYLSQDEPMRTGSQVTFTKPVILDYRFQWNYQPTGQVIGAAGEFDPVTSENDREATAPAVGGNLKVATFNVLNYFTDLGKDEAGCKAYTDRNGVEVATNMCQVRGAWTQAAFNDQQEKIVAAINALDADVVSLEEIETSSAITYLPGQDRDKALAHLVDALNAAGGSWAYAPSPAAVPTGEDVIRTAFIYDPTRVELRGASQILADAAFANARYPLAQTFAPKGVATPFVLVANHFKSKGSGEDDGTGQGLSNPARVAQANALTAWVDQAFADLPVMLMGDFNAYSKEDPVRAIEGKGYTNLAKAYEPESATYQFSGRLGSLDHVFANAAAKALVTGAGVWDINADESVAMQYSRRNYNVTDFHTALPYASSDHDPVVVGLHIMAERQQSATTLKLTNAGPGRVNAAVRVTLPDASTAQGTVRVLNRAGEVVGASKALVDGAATFRLSGIPSGTQELRAIFTPADPTTVRYSSARASIYVLWKPAVSATNKAGGRVLIKVTSGYRYPTGKVAIKVDGVTRKTVTLYSWSKGQILTKRVALPRTATRVTYSYAGDRRHWPAYRTYSAR